MIRSAIENTSNMLRECGIKCEVDTFHKRNNKKETALIPNLRVLPCTFYQGYFDLL